MKYTGFKILIITTISFIGCNNSGNRNGEIEELPQDDWALEGFTKIDDLNPILTPSLDQVFFCPVSQKKVKWEEKNILNPSAIVKDNKVYLIYRAQDSAMTSRLGIAYSEDGLHFTRLPEPILYPDKDYMLRYEWKGGVEDPRVVESEDGKYIMTYTSYDGRTARLCLASSEDLMHWTKHGLVLGEGEHRDTWSKSGAIVAKLDGNRIIATKINGKYWMYFGDTNLYMATSDDLIHWETVERKDDGKLVEVLQPRPGYFDSRLVEPGPYGLLTEKGILLIYNSSNAMEYNDPYLPVFTYSAGQALFDKDIPYRLVNRLNKYFIYPDKSYEKTGEVNNVCFVEGMVYFRNKWFLYYGTADSRIAAAVRE
jgi:predicted GH43/DUF377 family glycosyl hydrolase